LLVVTTADPDNVGEYLISARSYEEYRAMFALTDADLAGTVLDCPGGGSGFTARARAAGVAALAADPVYARRPELAGQLAVAETERGSAHTAAGADRDVWDFYGDLAGHAAIRRASAELFAADIAACPSRYVPAALPALPFADERFDLVLSSHFLFTYADRLDAEFHVAALRELYRVARGEVRIFPLLEQGGRPVPDLVGAVLSALARPCCLRTVEYEFQRGGNQMLVLGATR
jgi:hypothetical protein